MYFSIENTVVPLVERQAYILPVSEVAALQVRGRFCLRIAAWFLPLHSLSFP